jgi:hypothetical protein
MELGKWFAQLARRTRLLQSKEDLDRRTKLSEVAQMLFCQMPFFIEGVWFVDVEPNQKCVLKHLF